MAVFKKYPGLKLLTGAKDWPVTNWDPATAQKITSALLAKYPKIDGIISNYGTDAPGQRSRVPGRGPQARPGHDARRERAELPLQEERHRAVDHLVAQLARPHRGTEGDRRGGGPAEP